MTDKEFPTVAVVTMRSEPKPQNATYHLLNVLAELTTVSLVTVSLSENSPIHGEYDVTEISRGSKGGWLLRTAILFLKNQLELCRQIRRLDAEVVYFFGGIAYVLPIAFAKLVGKTVVVQPRGDVPLTLELEWADEHPAAVARLLASLVRALEFIGYALADMIVTYTESMADELGLARFSDKLYPHGTRYIAVDRFSPEGPFEDRSKRVGMVGRLDVEKGVERVAEAVRLLPKDVEFVFVGDGDRREWLERYLADEIESGRVELAGWVDHDEIPAYLSELRLLVLTSEPTEGLPTAIQESFACGTPVYAPPVSAIPDVVREGETGFIMDDRDPAAIAADVERILARDHLVEISENCRAFAVDTYSKSASVDRFRRLLSTLDRQQAGSQNDIK